MLSGEIDVLIELSDDKFRGPRWVLNGNDSEQMEGIEEGRLSFWTAHNKQVVVKRDADRQDESQLLVERYFRPHFDEL